MERTDYSKIAVETAGDLSIWSSIYDTYGSVSYTLGQNKLQLDPSSKH